MRYFTIILPATLLILHSLTESVCKASTDARWIEYLDAPLEPILPEEQALSNPPLFHWKPHTGAEHYVLRFARGEDQQDWTTPRNFYLPEAPLEPGIYHVEVKAIGEDEQVLDRSSWSFSLSEETFPFALPLNRFQSTTGQPFVIGDSDLAKLEAGTGGRAEYRDKLLAVASSGSAEELLDLEEPPLYPGAIWDRTLWAKKNTITYRFEDGITQQALAFRLTHDDAYRERAVNLLLKVSSWPATGATGVWESDHAAQTLLRSLSVGYNLLQADLSEEEARPIKKAIRERSRDMYAFLNPFVGKQTSAGMMNDPDNNHPWFCASALALGGLALLGEEDEAEDWLAFAAQLFAGVFLPRGDRQGGWHEGIDYWSYSLFYVCQFADALRTGTKIDFYQHPWLRNTGAFKVLAHPPTGAYIPFGNTKHNPPGAFDKLVMKRFASVYQDPLLWRYIDEISAEITHSRELFFACLWAGRDEIPREAASELPQFIHYEDMGWVVAHRSPFDSAQQVLFAFRSGPFFGRAFGHAHGDQNHFILTAGGEKLIWDSGYYDGYLTPHHRQFAVRSEAHNTLLVDGTGQVVHVAGADGRIVSYEQKGNSIQVEGDASNPGIYDGRLIRFRRNILFENWRELQIRDNILLDAPAHLSWMLQSVYPIHYDLETRLISIQGVHHSVSGSFETEHEVKANLHYGFPIDPDRQRGREDQWPNQYRLEIKTVDPVKSWEPAIDFKLVSPTN